LEAAYQQLQSLVSTDAYFAALYDQETNTVSFPVIYDEGNATRNLLFRSIQNRGQAR
jgi:hypothetical protein